MTINPENSTESSVEELRAIVTASEGSAELQRWLTETGGTWGSASLLELDAETVSTPVLFYYSSRELMELGVSVTCRCERRAALLVVNGSNVGVMSYLGITQASC